MTGWAVVNGRNMLLFNDRLSLDVWHVDNLRIPLQSDQLFRSNPINCFGPIRSTVSEFSITLMGGG